MRKLIVILIFIFSALPYAFADLYGYHIDNAYYKAEVNKDNVWTVTETVNVHFDEPRHGLYKFIPRIFNYSPDGTEDPKTYFLTIDDVKVDGYEYTTESSDDPSSSLVIKIGSADEYVDGDQSYVIHYTLAYPDDESANADFLSHVVWGTGWNCDVNLVAFSIHFEKPLPDDFRQNLHLYTGVYGSDSSECPFSITVENNTISGSVSDLHVGEGVTIAAPLPQGYWENPESSGMSWAVIIFGVIAGVLGLVVFFYAVFLKQRKPVRTIEFHAPEGISSAEVGKIIDDSSDISDLTSLIPWFANKGYLSIAEIPDSKGRTGNHADIKLTLLKPLPADAPKYQHSFMRVLFPLCKQNDTVFLSKLGDRSSAINLAKLALDAHFTGERRLLDLDSGFGWTVLYLIALWFFLVYQSRIEMFSPDYCTMSIFVVGLLLVMGAIRYSLAVKKYFKSLTSKILETVFLLLIFICGLGLVVILYDSPLLYVSLPINIAIYVASAFLMMLTGRFAKNTEYRTNMIGRLMGLKHFIKTAELDRLKALSDENPSYFFDILPYAMVFGLSDKWASQFSNISVQIPDWYESPNIYPSVSTYYLCSHISSALSNHIASHIVSASVAPSSGGGGHYGGGGFSFSGGGGGGGGGGSW